MTPTLGALPIFKRSAMTHGRQALCAGLAGIALACTMVTATGAAWADDAQNNGNETNAEVANVQQADATLITSDTRKITESGAYYVSGTTVINKDNPNGNGIKIAKDLNVLIYVPAGATLEVYGGEGKAAVLLPESSSLTITGAGEFEAYGGDAGNGSNGKDAWPGYMTPGNTSSNNHYEGGAGGSGGSGGTGAGAGIGTDGGAGGEGGAGGNGSVSSGTKDDADVGGKDGVDGTAGKAAEAPGKVSFAGSLHFDVQGGAAGKGGEGGNCNTNYTESTGGGTMRYSTCSGAGGGGGGGGEAAYGIGTGGAGGSGGGGGGGGGHYCDGVGGFLFTKYYWCGSEGGAGGKAATKESCGKQGTRTSNATKEDGKEMTYDSKYSRTSNPGSSADAVKSAVKSSYYAYVNDNTGEPSCEDDKRDDATKKPIVISNSTSFASIGGYTTTVTIDANKGSFGSNKTTLTIVPGADTVKTLKNKLQELGTPTRTKCTFNGFALTAKSQQAFCSATYDWSPSGAESPLYTYGYVSEAFAGSDAEAAMLTCFKGMTVYANWTGDKFSVTYNRNTAQLHTLGVTELPGWYATDDSNTKYSDEDSLTQESYVRSSGSSLYISSSMHSSDERDWSANQAYYLDSVNGYRLLGWTDKVSTTGEATGNFYECGSGFDMTGDSDSVTLYAVWGNQNDIYSPEFTAENDGNATVGYGYREGEGTITVEAKPYWGTDSNGNSGSYFLAALYGTNPTHTLSTKWQVYDEEAGSWTDVDDSYTNELDESAFTKNFTFDGSDYKAGKYKDRTFKSTLSIPCGFELGTSKDYRVVYTLKPTSESGETFTYEGNTVNLQVVEGSYPVNEFTFTDSDGNKVAAEGSITCTYDGNPHGISIQGMQDYGALSASVSYYAYDATSGQTGGQSTEAPTEPGTYYAVISFANSDENYNDPASITKVITIEKARVAIPKAKSDLAVSIDLGTGEAKEQAAFEDLDDKLYSSSGTTFANKGTYTATFEVNDTKHYVWENGSSAKANVEYSVSPAQAEITSSKITVGSKDYSLAWTGTSNTYDGKVKSAKLTSMLFGNGKTSAEFPTWLTHWTNGKPSDKDSCYLIYVLGNGTKISDYVVGYDKRGKAIIAAQIQAWVDGTNPGETKIYGEGSEAQTVTAACFDDVAEFGVKDATVKTVYAVFSGSENFQVDGLASSSFSIKKNVTLSVKTKTVTAKKKTVKKRKVTVSPITVKGKPAGVTLSFAKVKSGSSAKAYKALSVNPKTGKVTVKKGTKKGAYKLKVKLTTRATSTYNAYSKTVTVKVKVK